MQPKEDKQMTDWLYGKDNDVENNPRPLHEDIARLAYALWESRGGGDGDAEQDWLEAERRLTESTV